MDDIQEIPDNQEILGHNGKSIGNKSKNGKLHFRELTKKQQRFAMLIFTDMSDADKAEKAGYKCKTRESYQALGNRLRRYLLEKLALSELAEINGYDKADWLRDVMDIAKKDRNLKAYEMYRPFVIRPEDMFDQGFSESVTEKIGIFLPGAGKDWSTDGAQAIIAAQRVRKRDRIAHSEATADTDGDSGAISQDGKE